ncbi:MAG TPA: zf-TFIIB domain-containing protein [Kofleriaceae bacterium]|jgi:hypothetical protein
MTEPFRQRQNTCPECGIELRPFNGRLCCDRCEGMFLGVADLARSIDELVRVEPVIGVGRTRAGHRPCPTCSSPMAMCRLELAMLDKVVSPKVDVDHCTLHGFWFGQDKLAEVFVAVEREFGSHGGSSGPRDDLPGDGPLGSYGKFTH